MVERLRLIARLVNRQPLGVAVLLIANVSTAFEAAADSGLCLKPHLRLEWRGHEGEDEAEQCKHAALTLGDSFS